MKWVPSYSVARASGVSVTALPNAIHHRNVERTRTRCELMLGQGGCSQVTRAMIGADHEVGPKDCAPSKGGCRRSFWAQNRIRRASLTEPNVQIASGGDENVMRSLCSTSQSGSSETSSAAQRWNMAAILAACSARTLSFGSSAGLGAITEMLADLTEALHDGQRADDGTHLAGKRAEKLRAA